MRNIKLTDKEVKVLYSHLSEDLSFYFGGTFSPADENSKRDLKRVEKEVKIAKRILGKLIS